MVDGQIERDSMEPREKRASGFVASQLPVRSRESFLGNVLGIMTISKHRKQTGEKPVLILHNEFIKSIRVSLVYRLDNSLILY
jgi:hypothetical protein